MMYIFFRTCYDVFKDFCKRLKITRVKRQWRYVNSHNSTTAENNLADPIFPINKVKVGRYTYGHLNVLPYGKSDGNLFIGSFCSIANNVKFILGGGIIINIYYHFL